MLKQVFEAWLLLVYSDCIIKFRGLKVVNDLVACRSIRSPSALNEGGFSPLMYAMEMASIFYPKHVLCLQRSVATVLLLRRYGWSGQMVIGATLIPAQFHAWVELDGAVINDKPYVVDRYKVLKRC